MNFIVEFYKGLDAINLIIFWGVIIVVLLLLIFSIILVNNNRKLKRLLYEKENDVKEDDIPIIKQEVTNNNYEHTEVTNNTYEEKEIINNNYEEETVNNEQEEVIIKNDEPIKEEQHFVAEEHVIEYQPKEEIKEVVINTTERTPYQRNVLREMSSNQTSPIGITNNTVKTEYKQAKELNEILTNKEEVKQDNKEYLEDVSKKLEEATSIQRTEYELKQEEDAVISYKELMKKADSIKIDEDEDVVISIEELMRRKQEQEKLYKITPDAEDDSFIKELKDFRKDL